MRTAARLARPIQSNCKYVAIIQSNCIVKTRKILDSELVNGFIVGSMCVFKYNVIKLDVLVYFDFVICSFR